MKITAIKAQLKNSERVSIYVDGEYSFSLTQNQLLELRLYSSKELDDHELASLKHASDYGKLLERTINYLMIRPRSTKEVQDYLWRKKADPEMTTAVMERLQKSGYLDDSSFAKSWTRSRQFTKPVSKRRLTAELRQKGIDPDTIARAFEQEAYDEQVALHKLIAQKRKQSRYQDNNKLMQYLARQGFSYDTIKQALGL